jgi:hypothetical protein
VSESSSVSRDILAPADIVYAMVADITRMGEWSPENQGGVWIGGATAAAPGARFKSKNRAGKKSWSTIAKVVDADPGSRFSFCVSAGPVKVSEWTYSFEPTEAGCRVTESWQDLRPGWFMPIARLATGVRDRDTHNRAGMEQTLERLAAAAESEARPT